MRRPPALAACDPDGKAVGEKETRLQLPPPRAGSLMRELRERGSEMGRGSTKQRGAVPQARSAPLLAAGRAQGSAAGRGVFAVQAYKDLTECLPAHEAIRHAGRSTHSHGLRNPTIWANSDQLTQGPIQWGRAAQLLLADSAFPARKTAS